MPLPLIPIIGGMTATISLATIKYLLPFIIISSIKFLGITLISFTAIDLVTDQITNFVSETFGGLSSDVLNILRMGGVMDGINIILAGWVAQIQLRSILGAFSRMTFQPTSTN